LGAWGGEGGVGMGHGEFSGGRVFGDADLGLNLGVPGQSPDITLVSVDHVCDVGLRC
jgi:hypothetical protein